MTPASLPARALTSPRTLGIVAAMIMFAGCTSPAAQESLIPSATASNATQSPDSSSQQPSTEATAPGLVVRLDGAGEAGRVHVLTVFADGRVLLASPDGQGGMGPPVERRLTAAAVELIRDELAATGLTDASATYDPIPRPGAEPVGFGGTGPSLEVGLPDGGTAVITWYLFADDPAKDYYLPQPEAEVLNALAERLSSLADWLPADAWVDQNGMLAYEAPAGLLPPNSLVTVVVDQLQLRREPGLGAPVVGTASTSERFSVAGWFGPVKSDGLDWYRLTEGGDSILWAAAGSGEDQYLELVPPSCPSGDPGLETLINMASGWDRLACFGDRSLSLEGTFGCGICDGALPGDFSPFWLTYPIASSFLWADFEAGVGPLVVHADPDSGVELPEVGSIVHVTGHFSDPASTTCTISTFDAGRAVVVDPRTAEIYCREQFVLDTVEVIGTDPTYTDPYHP